MTGHSIPEDLNLQQPCYEYFRSHGGRFIVGHTRQKQYADVAYCTVCLED
jgi:hypothetical protein